MLLIYNVLHLGGIETFFVRLAKARSEKGLKTKILLNGNMAYNNKELFIEIQKYAVVYFAKDLFFNLPLLSTRFQLVTPFKKNTLKDMLIGVKQIHTTTGENALLAKRMLLNTRYKLALTVGFYHSKEFFPFFDAPLFNKLENTFVLESLPKENLITFSESVNRFYKEHNIDLTGSHTFRLGVIDKQIPLHKTKEKLSKIRMCTVSRIVDFKTYNFWILDVIVKLKKIGINVTYDIYGHGPLLDELKNKVIKLDLLSQVQLCESFDYSEFNNIVHQYDLFIGSGTAIVQASSLGVCSIVGIESIKEAVSYDFFHTVADYDYNINLADVPKITVEKLIIGFTTMSYNERQLLSEKHIQCVKSFKMETSVQNFEELDNQIENSKIKKFIFVRHSISKFFYLIRKQLLGYGILDNKYNKEIN